MGVPAFFRWLSRKYPSIVVHVKEEKAKIINGVKVPVDITLPNPNDFEFDNLYLDMNGIIHPCCHPENKPAPSSEDEMMESIFEYIDRLVAIIRPRKLLYMAIDGVAPRAKMNQQRSRRFRSSKDSRESREEIAKVKDELRMKGVEVPPDRHDKEHFDSNCITPGTEFMSRLAECLRYYVHVRMNTDPGWAQIMVILSDANVPGEGEHKIMDYIRRQRAQPDHDPNTRHCLCGADADLIMLGLATHEPNFTIIREEFKPNQERHCEICGQTGHKMNDCTGAAKQKQGEFDEKISSVASEQDFIFLRLNVLREYLCKELAMVKLPFKEDIERAIDDWVLMCFFVGNDFLPHLPSLEIREGAIDKLINIYKKVVYKTGGYLTDSGHVHLDRVQLMLVDLGEIEDEIFKRRRDSDENFKKRNERAKRHRMSSDAPAWLPGGAFAPVPLGHNMGPDTLSSDAIRNERQQNFLAASHQTRQDNQEAASQLRLSLGSNPKSNQDTRPKKRKFEEDVDEPNDEVRLWEEGWKDRYYQNKFGVGNEDSNFRSQVANEYILGICWVLKYYYQGCASWNWYFPYHYAPFASDFEDIGNLSITFPMDTNPFKPLEQLMSVFPAASKEFLPSSWQQLMFQADSRIIDFYPSDFKIDLNGKKYAWQGVALLPFVDETRLLDTLTPVYPNLSDYEVRRNSRGSDRLFVHKTHKSFSSLESLYEGVRDETKLNLNASLTNGVTGLVWCDEYVVLCGDVVKSPLSRMDDFISNETICTKFLDPQYSKGFKFEAKLLPNAIIPPPVVNSKDGGRSEYSNNHNASAATRMLRRSLNSYDNSPRRTPHWKSSNDDLNRSHGQFSMPQNSRRSFCQSPNNDFPRSDYHNQQFMSPQFSNQVSPRGTPNQRMSYGSGNMHGYQNYEQREHFQHQEFQHPDFQRPEFQHPEFQHPEFQHPDFPPRTNHPQQNRPRHHPYSRQ